MVQAVGRRFLQADFQRLSHPAQTQLLQALHNLAFIVRTILSELK